MISFALIAGAVVAVIAVALNFVVRQTGGPALTWYQVGLIVLSAMALTFTLLVLAPFFIFFEYLFGLD